MSFLSLILKQLRQRALSTVLTILSVALGVALATAILIFFRESDRVFGQSEFGYDAIVGPKSSGLELVLSNVYGAKTPNALIKYDVYDELATRQQNNVKWELPIQLGDNFKGYRILATEPKIIETPGQKALRDAVRSDVQATRQLLNDNVLGKTAALPLPGNSPAIPAIFATVERLKKYVPQAAAYDTMSPGYLQKSIERFTALMDLLPTSADRDLVQKTAREGQLYLLAALVTLDGPIQNRPDKPFLLATGRPFARDQFECVIGDEVARKLNLKIGDEIKAEHGAEHKEINATEHDEHWTITGILAPTYSVFDKTVLIPIVSALAIPEHEKGLAEQADKERAREGELVPGHAEDHHEEHYTMKDGHIELHLPQDEWRVSSIYVRSRQGFQMLQGDLRNHPEAMAVNPATEVREFTSNILKNFQIALLVLAILVSVVAAIGILVSIYNSMMGRKREIAILRALGATRQRILAMVCCEAGVIGVIGTFIGLAGGMTIVAIGSQIMQRVMGERLQWYSLHWTTFVYLAGVIVLSILAGLVPALKAYQTPVATNLSGE